MDSSERDNTAEVQQDTCVAERRNLNQPREEETLRERTLSRNTVFENPSLHEEDASTPLCGDTQMLQQDSTDTTRNRSFARRPSNLQFDRRLSCLSIFCLLSLVLACILLISGKKVLQRVGGGLFGVAIILCVAMIVESILHSSTRRQMPQNEQRCRRGEIVIEPPLNFDISQARTEWCMSSIEVYDKDSPPSYNSIISAPLVDQKPNTTERNNPYFKYFSTSLFSPTDCESCEDVVNPPPSYESLVELFLKSSTERNSNNVEQTEVTIDGNRSIFPEEERSRDHVVDMNT